MDEQLSPIVNVDDALEEVEAEGAWGGAWKVLTPSMRARGGRLGVVQMRLAQGMSTCPFHWHLREDEVFFVQSGRGFLRYGETLQPLRPGDCVSCPAGTQIAHQIANPYPEDLVYLAIGDHDPHEVCGYPDNGKLMVRGAKIVGRMERRPYMDGEPDPPRIFALIAEAGG